MTVGACISTVTTIIFVARTSSRDNVTALRAVIAAGTR